MINQRVMIYPVDSDYLPFLKQWECALDVFCYAPQGWFYVNKLISAFGNQTITVKDIKECTDYSSFDAVWIVNSNSELDFTEYILPVIEQAAKQNKYIRITRTLSAEEQILCSKLTIKKNMLCLDQELIKQTKDYSPNILRIQTPVVFVLGMFEHTGKLDTLLYLHKGIQQTGYKVKSILTRRNESENSNCLSFPDFMYDRQYSDTEKILLFNHFVRKLELETKPDIILIGLPGEIMPLDEKHTGNFGVIPFLISNAVHCDYAVLKLFHNYYDSTFTEKINEIVKNKFEIEINSFAVDNNILDATSISTATLRFYESEERPVDLPQNCYFNHVNGDGKSLCDDLIGTLQKFGKYRTI